MLMGKKLEKLVLATILAGSMAVGHSAFAGTEESGFENRGEATPLNYSFGGKPFVNTNVYANPGGSIIVNDDTMMLRDFASEEEKAALKGAFKYWYDVLGTPETLPNIDIYLTDIEDGGAAGTSDPDGLVTKLAKCFQGNYQPQPGTPDALVIVNSTEEDKPWNFDNLSILPRNGYENNYQSTIVHEMFHGLAVLNNTAATLQLDSEESVDLPAKASTLYEQNLYDFNGHRFSDCNKLAIVDDPEKATDDKTFYFLADKAADNEGVSFNGVYFKGKNVDEVLNINGQQALIAWPDDYEVEPVSGIPINGLEFAGGDGAVSIELSHYELQNSMQSHQFYRNWAIPMEAELATMQDLGYNIDRRKLYGNSIYNSDIEYVNNNPFYERKDGKYIEGAPSTQSLAIGLHIYGSNNIITQKSNLLADGEESFGIRVDGINNKLTIDKDSKVTANGLNGRGINLAYGMDHELNIEGTVKALGEGGMALAFDFGDNMLGNQMQYRGSYIQVEVDGDGDVSTLDMHSEILGALANNVNISGTVAGNEAAIYIAPNAYVKNINVKNGAVLEGDIISDWSPTGEFPDIMGEDLTITEGHICLPDGDDGMTRLNFAADELSYAGDISSTSYVGTSIIMNVNSGTLNYEGTAKVDSVNVAEGAILQGGTYKLDTYGLHIREDISKDNSGKLINNGMLSAALPNGKNTVLYIEGNVQNDGGSMALIANGNYVGTIKIDGDLEGNASLAVNPNGKYLPGDTYDVTNLVTFADGSAVEFTESVPYETAMLKANYSEDYKEISFNAENNLNSDDASVNAAFDEMDKLAKAVSASENQAWQEKVGELYKSDSAKATKALKSIKGSEIANIPALMQQNNLVRSTLGMRLSQVNRAKSVKVNVPIKQMTSGEALSKSVDITVKPEYDMWAKLSRNKGAINTASDYKNDAYSLGWDKQVNKDWRFGFFGSYAKGKFEAATITNHLQDYRLGVYGGYNKDAAEAIVYADYGWGKNKLHRNLNFMDLGTKSKYDSSILELGAEYKYDLQKAKAWHVAPYGAMQVNRYSQNSYEETGAEPFNQNVAKLNNTYAGLEAGVDLERRFENGSAYGMRMGYRRGLTGVEPKQNYHYAADPLHRYTNYGDGDKNKLVLGINGELQTAHNWTLSGEAGYERGKKGHGYSGEISLKYSW